jgi:transposase
MLRIERKQLSFYSVLYDKIPADHILKKINEAVDFGFINDVVRESYCENFGRPAREPELMMRILFLQYIYKLSDERIIEDAGYNLAWLWFLGLNPEDKLPDASLLAKFRTQRLKEGTLDEVLTEIVRQCVEKGIIKSSGIDVDATHMEANCIKKTPERMMRHLARRIFTGLEEDLKEVPESVDTDIPDVSGVSDHKEAKRILQEYLLKVIGQAEAAGGGEETKAAVSEARDILSDEKFILQKGVRSLADKDARVGYKSKTDNFFGYKAEFMMTTGERIITAAEAQSGEYTDGKDFDALLERTLKSGMFLDELYGDKAYFRRDILEKIADIGATSYIPVSKSAYKVDEELFSYNKDSDQWFCFMGNHTVSRESKTEKHKHIPDEVYTYYLYKFDKELCSGCVHRQECMGSQAGKAKKLHVSTSAPLFYEHSQRQKEPEFLEKYAARAGIEWKNGEMKRFHGMDRVQGFGLARAQAQVKLTAIAVNLKRIANILIEQEKDRIKRETDSIVQPFFAVAKPVFHPLYDKFMKIRCRLCLRRVSVEYSL